MSTDDHDHYREDGPVVPVGIDLGSCNARVSVGEAVTASDVASGSAAAVSVPNVVSNAQGSRVTPAVVVVDEEEEGEGEGGATSYLFGEAARRALARRRRPAVEGSVRRLLERSDGDASAFAAVVAFLVHLIGAACDAARGARPSSLRVALTAPSEDDDADVERALRALRAAARSAVREREGKGSRSRRAEERVVVGVVRDAAAVAASHGLLDSDDAGGWSRALVVDWGASGLSCVEIVRDEGGGPASVGESRRVPAAAGTSLEDSLAAHCAALLERRNRLPAGSVLRNVRAAARLTEVAGAALRALSRAPTADVAADAVFEGLDLCATVSRARSESAPPAAAVLRAAADALRKAVSSRHDVVLAAGGVCDMPAAKRTIKEAVAASEKSEKSKSVEVVFSAPGVATDERAAVGCAICARRAATGPADDQPSRPERLVPTCPVGVAVATTDDDDENNENNENNVWTLFRERETPLPAHVSRTFRAADDGVLRLVQTTNQPQQQSQQHKVLAEIDVGGQTEVELTVELSIKGRLSLAINGGETVVVSDATGEGYLEEKKVHDD